MATAEAEEEVRGVFKYSTMIDDDDDRFKLKVAGGEFADSEIIVLLGQHATGKTTFIRWLRGFPVPDIVRGPYIKYYSAYKAQTMLHPYPITVSELLDKHIHDETLNPIFVREVMVPLQIDHLMDTMVCDLSPQETQRLSLCMCLGWPAHIYLIDEPSAHLNRDQRDVAARVIKRFVTLFNKTAFVVEHDLQMVEHLADKVVVFEGTPSVDCVAKAPQPWDQFSVGTHAHLFWE